VHAFSAQVAFKGSFIVSMGEDHVLWTNLHALQTTGALLTIYVIRSFLVLKNAFHRTYLGTVAALSAGSYLEDARFREARHYRQRRLLRIVLLKMIKGAGQLTKPAPCALGAISP